MEELALHLLDILENALAAGARQIHITIDEDKDRDLLTVIIQDDGRGMGAEEVRRATDPFYTTRTTRKVGLGLSLFEATAKQCDGALSLASQPGRGTRVVATMRLSHPDLPPLGDIGATIAAALCREEPVDLVYRHRRGAGEFRFSSAWLRLHLGEIPLNCGPVLDWVQRYINKGLAELYGGERK